MVDKEIINVRLGIILNNLSKLKNFSKMQEKKFLSDPNNAAAAKYYLQTSIEAIVDIGNHIIARERLGVPQNSFETLEILSHNKIIKKENLVIYRKMIKFRNTIVHLYHIVDDSRVFEILQNNLGDFNKFVKEIKSFLMKSSRAP